MYPVTDHDFARPSYLPLGWFWDLYVPDVSMRDRPDISPLRADLAGLPPAHIVVAGNDPLHDEGVAYADSLRVAGVPVTVTDYPSLVHGFFRLTDADPAARAAVPELANAVETLFDRATGKGK